MQRTDVTDGLENTLVMLSHKLGDGVTVVRDYAAGLPPIQAHVGELNQVWTNLIDNAVEAMDGKGVLELSTRAEQDDIVIDVGDTARECRRTWLPAHSRPFSQPRRLGRAPASAWTSHTASSQSATAALLPSIRDQAGQYSGSGFPSGRRNQQHKASMSCPRAVRVAARQLPGQPEKFMHCRCR